MIQTYFTQIKRIIDQYATTSFVLEAQIQFDMRPGNQGYLTGTLIFADGSKLHFSEYVDQTGEVVAKLMYTYHYQDTGNQLIFRYDNALHKPALPSVEHKKSNGLPVRIYQHHGFRIETISLATFEEREDAIRAEFADKFGSLFRGNQIQKENAFQRSLLDYMDKSSLYTVDYIPSRGKNEGQETTLYYHNRELFAWLKDTASLEDGHIVKSSRVTTVWTHAEIPKANIANEGGVKFPRGKKPEQLLCRSIEMSTHEGDMVFDSFAGSGTTGAVAHKMGRRWIMVELGEHCHTHILPRLKKVIDGKDPTGITETANWKGGGGFRYYRLGPSLIVEDAWGNLIINPALNAAMLAEAMCKLGGGYVCPQ